MTTVKLTPTAAQERCDYLPGQFQFITFHCEDPEVPVEEHHWTISSTPTREGFVTSTIKASGDFTAKVPRIRPGMKDEFLPGKSPHGAFLKIYVNRPVVQNSDDLPYKSIIVKENYAAQKEQGEDQEKKPGKLGAITIMYRMKKGYDPENNDWYWVKYLPNGKVAKTDDGMPIAGKVKSCIECHASAAGDDYIFTNDE